MTSVANAKPASQGRWKFVVGGVLIFAAIVYLIVSSTQSNAQYFLTVEELNQRRDELMGRELRVSGVVLGDTIQNDTDNLELTFTVAHIPGDHQLIEELGGMAVVLREAAKDSSLPRMRVVYHGVRPDLLKDESQAIMTGYLREDGTFVAEELLLKCPTKYEEAVPDQVAES